MRRGEVYFANLNPTIGAEVQKIRPVLVISNDDNNKKAATVTVAPITSNAIRVYPFEVLLPIQDSGLGKLSKLQCHQIRTISKLRIVSQRVAKVSPSLLTKIEQALSLHLNL